MGSMRSSSDIPQFCIILRLNALGGKLTKTSSSLSEAFGHSSTLYSQGEATKLNKLVQSKPFCDSVILKILKIIIF